MYLAPSHLITSWLGRDWSIVFVRQWSQHACLAQERRLPRGKRLLLDDRLGWNNAERAHRGPQSGPLAVRLGGLLLENPEQHTCGDTDTVVSHASHKPCGTRHHSGPNG